MQKEAKNQAKCLVIVGTGLGGGWRLQLGQWGNVQDFSWEFNVRLNGV